MKERLMSLILLPRGHPLHVHAFIPFVLAFGVKLESGHFDVSVVVCLLQNVNDVGAQMTTLTAS